MSFLTNDLSMASKYTSLSDIPSSLESNVFPWNILLRSAQTARSCWGPDLENRVGTEAILSAIHVVSLLLLSSCDTVHCLGERALFPSSFVAVFC